MDDGTGAEVRSLPPRARAVEVPGQLEVFDRLLQHVIEPGLCTHCGTCVGLSGGTLRFCETARGPAPVPSLRASVQLPEAAWAACPGRGPDYPDLCTSVFGGRPENWLLGCYRQVYIGYSRVPEIRRRAASGGVITQTLAYLLQEGLIDGAVVVRQGVPAPWLATPIIARSADEIEACSQSVYVPVPVNTVLAAMAEFDGRLAYVGLPDQVASLRRLQQLGHPGARKVAYVLGPYMGTSMYLEAIESYLRSNGIQRLEEIAELRYREGEWPGHLYIRTRSGRVLRASKFYYNYLIPFYVTRSSLLSVDFTNELADLSVGDAWHPRYEAQGKGFSVVVVRSEPIEQVLRAMEQDGLLALEDVAVDDVLAMHGHMLDFKKRGAFIRLGWRAALGRPVPEYGYRPQDIPLSRQLAEAVITAVFAICQTRTARRMVERVPLRIVGPVFDALRKGWKQISKPSKRRGLRAQAFEIRARVGMDGAARHGLWGRTWTELGYWRRRQWSLAEVATHWDNVERYDEINERTYSYFRRFTDGLLLSEVQDRGRVLDLCARTGKGTLYFFQQGKVGSAVCADVATRMGEICRRRLHAAGVPDVTWMHLSDSMLPHPAGEFDTVLCFETVEHFPEPARLLRELGRVTRPGGTLILTTPNVLWEPVHGLAAITGLHHSEGPHRFIRFGRLLQMVHDAGFHVQRGQTTVLIPAGPALLLRLGEWLERYALRWLMPWIGLRRVLICRRE